MVQIGGEDANGEPPVQGNRSCWGAGDSVMEDLLLQASPRLAADLARRHIVSSRPSQPSSPKAMERLPLCEQFLAASGATMGLDPAASVVVLRGVVEGCRVRLAGAELGDLSQAPAPNRLAAPFGAARTADLSPSPCTRLSMPPSILFRLLSSQ